MENVAVCLFFDAEIEASVCLLWEVLANKHISADMPNAGWRPHITLSGCHEVDIDEYSSPLKQFARRTAPIEVTLSSVGYFSGNRHTLFLTPTITQSLITLHAKHDELVRKYSPDLSPYYEPDHWVPHCTLV